MKNANTVKNNTKNTKKHVDYSSRIVLNFIYDGDDADILDGQYFVNKKLKNTLYKPYTGSMQTSSCETVRDAIVEIVNNRLFSEAYHKGCTGFLAVNHLMTHNKVDLQDYEIYAIALAYILYEKTAVRPYLSDLLTDIIDRIQQSPEAEKMMPEDTSARILTDTFIDSLVYEIEKTMFYDNVDEDRLTTDVINMMCMEIKDSLPTLSLEKCKPGQTFQSLTGCIIKVFAAYDPDDTDELIIGASKENTRFIAPTPDKPAKMSIKLRDNRVNKNTFYIVKMNLKYVAVYNGSYILMLGKKPEATYQVTKWSVDKGKKSEPTTETMTAGELADIYKNRNEFRKGRASTKRHGKVSNNTYAYTTAEVLGLIAKEPETDGDSNK